MKVGVDARPLCVPTFGIGRYTRALLDRFVTQQDVQWYLYADRPLLHDFSAHPNVVVRTVDNRGRLGRLLLSQWGFSRWAAQDRLDLFWSPRHHLPLLLPRGMKAVVTIHDLVWRRFPETMLPENLWLERLLMPPSLGRADRIVAVSGATRADIVADYPATAGKVSVIHEAADTYPMDPVRLRAPYFVFVGTLEPRKNLQRLLQAFVKVREQLEEVLLVVIGGEGWHTDLAAIIGSLELDDSVIVLGHVDDEVVYAHLAGAIALCLPSLYEGFGLPALEAMQFGTPVVGSKVSAVPEVVGTGGLLVDPFSSSAIADAMVRVANDRTLRSTLSASARLQADQFSWDKTAEETLSLFRQLSG